MVVGDNNAAPLFFFIVLDTATSALSLANLAFESAICAAYPPSRSSWYR